MRGREDARGSVDRRDMQLESDNKVDKGMPLPLHLIRCCEAVSSIDRVKAG